MKRRRQVLQVSTFPFLAVLLCAMGSLILLLLVIDRRAKAVARAKALAAVNRMADMDSRKAAAREAEWEKRRQALHALLAGQDERLAQKIKGATQAIQARRHEIQAEQARTQAIHDRIQITQTRLSRVKAELASRQQATAAKTAQTEVARKELQRYSEEIRALEQTLEDLRLLRQRDQQTYSLVPYRGRRGENRKPIYVECTARALIFHPERVVLEGRHVTVPDVLAEVTRQMDRQRRLTRAAGQKDEAPYLLLLIRPDGIPTYYRFLTAVQGMKFDFGYEFVEPDWVLDFSEGDDAPGTQAWMTAAQPAPPPASALPKKRPGLPYGVPTGVGGLVQGVAGPRSLACGSNPGQAPGNGAAGPAGAGTGSGRSGASSATSDPSVASGTGSAGRVHGVIYGNGSTAASAAPDRPAGLAFGQLGPNPSGPSVGSGPSAATGIKGLLFGNASTATTGSGDGTAGLPFGPPGTGSPGQNTAAGSGTPTQRKGLVLGNGSPASGGAGSSGGGAGTGNGSVGATGASSAVPTWQQVQGGPTVAGPAAPGGTRGAGTTGGDPRGPAGRGTDAGGTSDLITQEPSPADGRPLATPASNGQGTTNAGSAGGRTGSAAAGSSTKDGASPSNMGLSGSGGMAGGSGSGMGATGQGGDGPSGDPRAGQSNTTGAGAHDGFTGPVSDSRSGTSRRPPPAPPLRTVGNRDWIIPVECTADAVIVRTVRLRYATAQLPREIGASHPLVQAVRQMIERRQSLVRPGELPYRPIIRFLVQPDGQRSYYIAYPLFEGLGVPMVRQNLERAEPKPVKKP